LTIKTSRDIGERRKEKGVYTIAAANDDVLSEFFHRRNRILRRTLKNYYITHTGWDGGWRG